MRIRFESEGGFGYFPGLQRPLELDTDRLPSQQASRLEQLVRDADFLDRRNDSGAPQPGAADYRTYTITIQDGTRARTLKVAEPIHDRTLRALVEYLTAQQRSGS